jgi:hypothetical protein
LSKGHILSWMVTICAFRFSIYIWHSHHCTSSIYLCHYIHSYSIYFLVQYGLQLFILFMMDICHVRTRLVLYIGINVTYKIYIILSGHNDNNNNTKKIVINCLRDTSFHGWSPYVPLGYLCTFHSHCTSIHNIYLFYLIIYILIQYIFLSSMDCSYLFHLWWISTKRTRLVLYIGIKASFMILAIFHTSLYPDTKINKLDFL